ncbi:MAG: hypothetical protein ACI9EA_001065, partial [Pseudomonadales bacterium]
YTLEYTDVFNPVNDDNVFTAPLGFVGTYDLTFTSDVCDRVEEISLTFSVTPTVQALDYESCDNASVLIEPIYGPSDVIDDATYTWIPNNLGSGPTAETSSSINYIIEIENVCGNSQDQGEIIIVPIDDEYCGYFDCNSLDLINWPNLSTGVYPSQITLDLGETLSIGSAINLNETWLNEEDGNTYVISAFELESLTGLPSGVGQALTNSELPISAQVEEQICLSLTGLAYPTGTYQVEYSGIMTVVFGSIEVDLPAVFTQTIEILWDGLDIPGCTYLGAENFNLVATLENGQCIFEGCTDSYAINYLQSANMEDGSCLYSTGICSGGLVWVEELQTCVNPSPDCIGDLNGDGFVTLSDLTILLTVYGSVCD